MSDYKQEGLGDELFDALLEQAVKQNLINEINSIPSEEELEQIYTFSKEHNRIMKKMFARDNSREIIFVVLRWTKVAVFIICVAATLLFGTMMVSAEFREAVSNVIITWYERFTNFQSMEVGEDFTQQKWIPRYIPDGFAVSETYEFGDFYTIEYNNADGIMIDYTYLPEDASTSIDNEEMDYSIITEGDITYHLFRAMDVRKDSKIVWHMYGYRFTIVSNYDADELLQMAFSVK